MTNKSDIFRVITYWTVQYTGFVFVIHSSPTKLNVPHSKIPHLALLILILLLPLSSNADNKPDDVIRTTIEAVLPLLNQNIKLYEDDREELYAMIRKNIEPHINMNAMSQQVLGRELWNQATSQQQDDFIEQFRTLLLRTYGLTLLAYTNQKVIYHPSNYQMGDTKASVITEVKQDRSRPFMIEYKLHNNKGAWKVYDIVIEGASIVKVYKGQFSSKARNEGMNSLLSIMYKSNIQSRK